MTRLQSCPRSLFSIVPKHGAMRITRAKVHRRDLIKPNSLHPAPAKPAIPFPNGTWCEPPTHEQVPRSGDSGACKKKSRYVYPADDAFITSVGGTELTTNGLGGPRASETAWAGSGGGTSPNHIAIPNYQTTTGAITSANKGSNALRNVTERGGGSEHGQLHLL